MDFIISEWRVVCPNVFTKLTVVSKFNQNLGFWSLLLLLTKLFTYKLQEMSYLLSVQRLETVLVTAMRSELWNACVVAQGCNCLLGYNYDLNCIQRCCGHHLSSLVAGNVSGPECQCMTSYSFCCGNAYLREVGGHGGYALCPYAAFCHPPLVCCEGEVLRRRMYLTPWCLS